MARRHSVIRLGLGVLALAWCASAGSAQSPAFPGFPDPAERSRLLRAERPTAARLQALPGGAIDPRERDAADVAQDWYDLRHVRLEIDLTDYELQQFHGVATQRITSKTSGLGEALFDLWSSVLVDSVTVNGLPVDFAHDGEFLRVPLQPPLALGRDAEIRVVYHGGTGPARSVGMTFDVLVGDPNIWTQSQPDLGRYWWPSKDRPDDKADSSDVFITAPDWMTATSNGLLKSVVEGPGPRKTWWWHGSYPIAPYLISVTAGVLTKLSDTYRFPDGSTMPLEYYVLPSVVPKAEVDCNITAEAIDLYSRLFGPYPFAREKYGVTTCGLGGGMEHQTNTSYGWFIFNGQHTSDWIYVHELAHMWWGDNVTCATWADCWLNEGFASWCEALWFEHRFGAETYRDYMVGTQWVSDPSGPIYDYPRPFDESVIYNKGAWVVHMLRGVLGDSTLFRGLADYRALFEGRTVTTAQFQEVMEAAYGDDLDWFFQEWVYGMNRPHYRVSRLAEPAEQGQRLYIHLRQEQTDTGIFRMPVRLRVWADSTARDTLVWSDGAHEDFWVDLPAGRDSVEVDPDHWILREVEEEPYGLNLLTSCLDSTYVDSTVSLPLLARGGSAPYYWEALDPPPFGVTLDAYEGRLVGAPTQAGDYTLRVRVSDSSVPMRTDEQRISWTILPVPGDTTTTPIVIREVRAVPNPTLRATLLTLQGPADAGPAEWRVFDPAGRLVATGESREPSGDGTLRSWLWDGRNREGDRVPPGIYLVQGRLMAIGRTVTGRLVRLQ